MIMYRGMWKCAGLLNKPTHIKVNTTTGLGSAGTLQLRLGSKYAKQDHCIETGFWVRNCSCKDRPHGLSVTNVIPLLPNHLPCSLGGIHSDATFKVWYLEESVLLAFGLTVSWKVQHDKLIGEYMHGVIHPIKDVSINQAQALIYGTKNYWN